MIEAVIEKLLLMRLFGMAEGLREQNDAYRDLSFEERFGLLVDKERLYRENSQIKTLLSHAHLRHCQHRSSLSPFRRSNLSPFHRYKMSSVCRFNPNSPSASSSVLTS